MKRALMVALLLASAASAHADRWTWSAPDDCSSESALRESIAARVASSVDVDALDVDVAIVAGDGGYTATLAVDGPIVDHRTLTSESCSELTDALAIVLARLASFVEPPRAIVHVAPATIRVDPAAKTSWNGGVRLSGVVGTGGAPDVGVAAELGVWASWRSFAVELSIARWKANEATVSETMAGVDVGLDSFALRAMYRPEEHRLRGWLVGEIGSMEGVGMGLDDARRGSARWSAVGGGGAFTWTIADHVGLVAATEVEFLIDHVRFALDAGSVLYRTPAVAVRGSLGIEVGWR